MIDVLSIILIAAGLVFFAAGTAGLLRFPDVYTRLHALTKADNLGLGLVVLGLLIRADALAPMFKLVLVWALVLVAGAAACHLVAQRAWTRLDGEDES
ncbi:cation:proton antiporter [Thioalkalivibrio sulfidiphilus]|uniref:cation:proton antiporter n=1 Tax=Thioalkalivibrio sulfidiphilus TaxID=1033854 RepID=UPI00036A373C|nr:monovalent cation/H(+) antiporter subunit G [Thioalkalivibrio sulfidiphilus]